MEYALALGIAAGLGLAWLLGWLRTRSAGRTAEEIYRQYETQLKDSFGKMSLDALGTASRQFLELAKSRLDTERKAAADDLDTKKQLIDGQLNNMNEKLRNVTELMSNLEKDRAQKYGELAAQLTAGNEQVQLLTRSTAQLREALSGERVRGQWGQRMAEDVLRIAGFIEGTNYYKQREIQGDEGKSKPDFTFLLPRNLKLHMDAKFPLENYIAYLKANTDAERDMCRKAFMRNVRDQIKEITSRDYIDPSRGTVDYAIMFIPNEQVYAFIHEQDMAILDEALSRKVILSSPVTLYAILAVIRQAVDSFALEQASNEILSLLAAFNRQWAAFHDAFRGVGDRIQAAQKAYDSVATTRKNKLEIPLNRIEDIRKRRGLPTAPDDSRLTLEGEAASEDGQTENGS